MSETNKEKAVVVCSNHITPGIQCMAANCAECGRVIYIARSSFLSMKDKAWTAICITCAPKLGFTAAETMKMTPEQAEELRKAGVPQDIVDKMMSMTPEQITKSIRSGRLEF